MANSINIIRYMALGAVLMLSIACSDNREGQLTHQTEQYIEALRANDHKYFVGHTHPKAVILWGGPKQMIALLQRDEGMPRSITRIEAGEPGTIYAAGEELHALIPYTYVMKVQDGKYIFNTHLMAVSQDDGRSWLFSGLSKSAKEDVPKVFPDYNKEMDLPDYEEPEFIAD
ncbi:MAG: hypothetical protein WBB45_06590 [Cyclobacteriaceae bacterium]